ncbi:hypothetical protein C8R44DRAFT_303066 [Mycena epipterygia]|nr:hypothetical protein C8R44DRAFT_303066 [Mycena epipterygia]
MSTAVVAVYLLCCAAVSQCIAVCCPIPVSLFTRSKLIIRRPRSSYIRYHCNTQWIIIAVCMYPRPRLARSESDSSRFSLRLVSCRLRVSRVDSGCLASDSDSSRVKSGCGHQQQGRYALRCTCRHAELAT